MTTFDHNSSTYQEAMQRRSETLKDPHAALDLTEESSLDENE